MQEKRIQEKTSFEEIFGETQKVYSSDTSEMISFVHNKKSKPRKTLTLEVKIIT